MYKHLSLHKHTHTLIERYQRYIFYGVARGWFCGDIQIHRAHTRNHAHTHTHDLSVVILYRFQAERKYKIYFRL